MIKNTDPWAHGKLLQDIQDIKDLLKRLSEENKKDVQKLNGKLPEHGSFMSGKASGLSYAEEALDLIISNNS